MPLQITRELAIKVRDAVDAGLVSGIGQPVPGQMCVEAAVCFALGMPHGDDPGCVAPSLRRLKIRLNDCAWSDDQARAKGLRRLALAQLGSADYLDELAFVRRVLDYTLGTVVPRARGMAVAAGAKGASAAYYDADAATARAYYDTLSDNSNAAYYAAYAAHATALAAYYAARAAPAEKRDAELALFAEGIVQILVAMGAPGCQWLDLVEAA